MASWVVLTISSSTLSCWHYIKIVSSPLIATGRVVISTTSFTIVQPIINSYQVVGHAISKPTILILSFFGVQNVTYEQLHFFIKTLFQYLSVAVIFGFIVGIATGFGLHTVSYLFTPSSHKKSLVSTSTKSKRDKATQHNSLSADFNSQRQFLFDERKLQLRIKVEQQPKLDIVTPSVGSTGVKIYETDGWSDVSTKR